MENQTGGNTFLIRLVCLDKLFGLISLTVVYLSGLFFQYCCLFSPLSVNMLSLDIFGIFLMLLVLFLGIQ